MPSNLVINTYPKNSPAPLRSEAEARNRQDDVDEIERPSDQAFDILLNAVSQSQGRFDSIQDIKSAEVMFESPSEKGAANTSQRFDDSQLSSNELRQEARLDRTSLDSRKAGTDLNPPSSQDAVASKRVHTSSDFAERSLNSQGSISAERFSKTIERNTQASRLSSSGDSVSNREASVAKPLQNELPPVDQKTVPTISASAKVSAVSQSSTSSAAQQVAKILAAGPQTSAANRPALGQSAPSLSRGEANTRQAKGATADQPATYEDTARKVNTRRPGAAAFEQLVQSIRLRSMAGRSSATLQLNPPELGRIVVNVEMNGDDVHIDVHTETPEAKELLSSRVDSLREALQGVGVQVDQIQVEDDVNVLPDQQVDSQNARPHDEKPNTSDHRSSFSRKVSGVSNARTIHVPEVLREVRSAGALAGRIDVKI